MPNTRELLVNPKLKVLVSSPPGGGKTTLAGTITKIVAKGRVYVFDFDQRIHVLSGLDIDYDSYDCTSPVSHDLALKKLDEILKGAHYEALILDGLTTFSAAAMAKAQPLVKAFMPKARRLGSTPQDEIPIDMDYNAQMTYVEKFTQRIVARFPGHVVFTAHEKDEKKEVPGQTDDSGRKKLLMTGRKQIAVSGQLSERYPGNFNELWRMGVELTADSSGHRVRKYRVQTRSDNETNARTSYPDALLDYEEPDFGVIYAKILKHLASKAPAPEPVKVSA